MDITEYNIAEATKNADDGEVILALKGICKVLEDLNVQVKVLRTDVGKLVENVR